MATEVLPPDNVNTGIAHIKLGRVLLRQNRFAEAEGRRVGTPPHRRQREKP